MRRMDPAPATRKNFDRGLPGWTRMGKATQGKSNRGTIWSSHFIRVNQRNPRLHTPAVWENVSRRGAKAQRRRTKIPFFASLSPINKNLVCAARRGHAGHGGFGACALISRRATGDSGRRRQKLQVDLLLWGGMNPALRHSIHASEGEFEIHWNPTQRPTPIKPPPEPLPPVMAVDVVVEGAPMMPPL